MDAQEKVCVQNDGTVAKMLESGFDKYEMREFKERCDAYAIAITHGFLTVNEVRRLERLPELEKAETV